MADLITGIYYDRSSAEQAVDKLESFGYKRDDISVIMHDRTRAKEFAQDTGTTAGSPGKVVDAAKSAAKVGAALAAILAGAAALGAARHRTDEQTTTVTSAERGTTGTSTDVVGDYGARSSAPPSNYVEPGSGVRAGAVATSVPAESTSDSSAKPFVAGPLAAVLLPALGAGLISAFSKAGIPKEHAESYAHGLETGGIVVGVQARSGDESRIRQALNG